MVPSLGEEVLTLYGSGTVMKYRQEDAMYVVKLEASGATLYTMSIDDSAPSVPETKTSMELNVAYEAFEKMRKLNLELECAEAGIIFSKDAPMDYEMCTTCLIAKGPTKKIISSSPLQNATPAFVTSTGKPLFPRLYKLRMESQDFLKASQQTFYDKTKTTMSTTPACLLCGSPTCSEHSSPAFRKEKITLCTPCVQSLEFNFDDDSNNSETLTKHVDHLVDLYDRAVLLLQYSSQFMLQVAASLEESTKHHNKVGVGGSSVGLVSGVLGVAAAACILTPAGPPLLIASLVFGGSATVVQTGSEAMKYLSEPNQLADRMMALHGMIQSILSTTMSMRETTLVPYLDRAVLSLTKKQQQMTHKPLHAERDAQVKKAVTAGVRAGSTAATGMATLGTGLVQEGAAAGRFMSRAGTNLARSARFARFAGGALSAATLVLEARELTKTVEQIRQGNPCEKAAELRKMHAQLERLPSTSTVDAMCQSYVKVRAKQLATKRLLDEQHKMEQSCMEEESDDLLLVEEVVSSLEAQQKDNQRPEPYAPSKMRVDLSKSSLLERVQRYKERQARDNAGVCLVV